MKMQLEGMDEHSLDGVLERITFHAPDTGWTVARLQVSVHQVVNVVGNMLSPDVGESVRLFGEWADHPQYGRQFRFTRYQLVRPTSAAAIRAYLSGGLVEGIGPALAERLVKRFGDKTLDILDSAPERVCEVPGIGEKRAASLLEAWQRHKTVHRIMVFLHEKGIGGAIAGRIYARYGDQSVEILEREPYRLAKDIRGIGFLTADRIARVVGISAEDPSRIEAGLLHVLDSATGEGHLFLPAEPLMERAESLLDVSRQHIEMGLDRLVASESVVREALGDETGIFLKRMHDAECQVADVLSRLTDLEMPGAPGKDHILAWLKRRESMGATELTPEQSQAVVTSLRSGLCVITGGPGTGKTTVTRAIVDACQSLGKRISLASPTGRAAKRLEQLAAHPATTIHRLLVYDPFRGGFKHGPEQPLDTDVVLVDEASMLDILLARDLLRALPDHARLILVGDADQLPSVGPGNVLRDLVASRVAPVCRLTQVFRQAEGSDIIRSAHLLNRGESPRFPKHEQWLKERGDCVWLEEEDPEAAAERVIRTATQSLPKMGFNPREIQIITPLHRGPIGVKALNERLQEALNPAGPGRREVRRGETVFREGDRVLQTANNYDKGVYNGDIGFISAIDRERGLLVVEYELGRVEYGSDELEDLALAYALTVHKSQGSEYPAVVMVIHASHYIMLQRNLLYTALTRAQRMACIVGNQRGIWRAINNVSQRDRFTRLAERLSGRV